MTTPAINRNVNLTRNCIRTASSVSPSGGVTPIGTPSLYSLPIYSWDKESRPASGNSSFDANGFRRCRSWSHSGHRWIYPSGTAHYSSPSGPNRVQYDFDGGGWWSVTAPSLQAFPNSVVNRAEIAALTKLKSQDIHLGNFIAEFGQTERMIGGHIASIARQVSHFRRTNPKKIWEAIQRYERSGCGRRYVSLIPHAWLELQYSWRPLLSDIFGAINHLSKGQRDPLVSVKGYAFDEDRPTQNYAGFYGSTATVGFKATNQAWVRLYYRLNSPGLAEASSLGLVNPLEIVWEIIPYSFVVDWVLPIGPWLGSLTADAGFTFVGGSLSRMSKLKDGNTVSVNWNANATEKKWGDTPYLQGEAYSFVRSCYLSSPVPGLYVKNPLSAVHVLNATALLVQAFH